MARHVNESVEVARIAMDGKRPMMGDFIIVRPGQAGMTANRFNAAPVKSASFKCFPLNVMTYFDARVSGAILNCPFSAISSCKTVSAMAT